MLQRQLTTHGASASLSCMVGDDGSSPTYLICLSWQGMVKTVSRPGCPAFCTNISRVATHSGPGSKQKANGSAIVESIAAAPRRLRTVLHGPCPRQVQRRARIPSYRHVGATARFFLAGMSRRRSQRLASAAPVIALESATEENHCQPSSADSLHAPRPPAAHTPNIAHADGFGALSPATPKAQDPAPPARARDSQLCKDTSQRPSWNALRRYYSEASSFPDYGPAQPVMGPERLIRTTQRPVNQSWAPLNTLTKSGSKRELPESSSVSHQTLAKRQRLEIHLKDSLSPESVHRTTPSSSRSTFNSRNHAAHAGSARASASKLDSSLTVYDIDTEPSNITSDIAPRLHGPKWRSSIVNSPALSKQTAKHPVPSLELDEIETSEDELQSNHTTVASNVRQTNFSQIKASPRSRRRMRGDITPTKFREIAPGEVTKQHVAILKAVSGKEMYESTDGNYHPLSLHRSSSKPSLLEAWSNGKPDEEHQWVSFDAKYVSNIRYGGCYLSFRRSMIRGRPPTITLQFVTAEGAAQVAKMLDERIVENHTREEMKQLLDVAWKNAVQSSYHLSHGDADTKQVYATRERRERYDNTQKPPKPQEGDSRKLKDKMTTRPEPSKEQRRSASPVRRLGMETRRTRRLSPSRKEVSPVFERWSAKNTSWEKDWNQTLVYPATGRNRASVDKEDILRLDEGEFLNDNLISFYLRYLQTNMERERPELFNRVHIFSTFFFAKLTSSKGGINYDGVKSWTAKLDLFSYDYIVVPVNENAHWYLAVICNTPKLLDMVEEDSSPAPIPTDALGRPKAEPTIMTTVEREMSDISLEDDAATRRSSRQLSHSRLRSSGPASSPPAKTASAAASSPAPTVQGPRAPSRRSDASQPRIVTLDSLGLTHSATCRVLKEYLVEEAKDKKKIDLVAVPGGMKARGIPEQMNFCDCGIFVLGYMEEFLKDPDALAHKILSKDKVDWSMDAARLRNKIRSILFRLQKEQTERLSQEREAKRHQKRMSKPSSLRSSSDIVHEAKHARSIVISERDEEEPATPRPSQQIPPASSATCRSVTPPATATRSPNRAASEMSAEDGIVDLVTVPT